MKGSVLMKSHLPTISQVYSLLLQEESQRKIHSTSQFLIDSASLNVNTSRGSPAQSQSYFNSQRKPNYDSRKPIHCNYGKKSGHVIDKCYKIHGFPTDFKFTKPKRVVAHVDTDSQGSVVPNFASSGNSVIVAGTSCLIPELCTQLFNLFKTSQM